MDTRTLTEDIWERYFVRHWSEPCHTQKGLVRFLRGHEPKCALCGGMLLIGDKIQIAEPWFAHFTCWKARAKARKEYRQQRHEAFQIIKAERAKKPRYLCPRCSYKLWQIPSSGLLYCYRCRRKFRPPPTQQTQTPQV